MRLFRSTGRFIVVASLAVAIVAANPATAIPEPENLTPNPARQPTFHRSQSAGFEMGALRIPSIDVDEVIRSGVSLSVIDQGVSHWAGTSAAGDSGNVVLAGHRTTHSRPFFDIDRLDEGDLIFLTDGTGFEMMYRVTDAYVVEPEALWITYETDAPTLTMFACHPKGSARYRYVVNAELVTGRPIA